MILNDTEDVRESLGHLANSQQGMSDIEDDVERRQAIPARGCALIGERPSVYYRSRRFMCAVSRPDEVSVPLAQNAKIWVEYNRN